MAVGEVDAEVMMGRCCAFSDRARFRSRGVLDLLPGVPCLYLRVEGSCRLTAQGERVRYR
jgi:hypothetical protein